MPVFESDSLVLKAIASGECNIGIVLSASLLGAKLSVHIPSPAAVDIDGIGIGRHARNPEGAAVLLEWMLSTQVSIAESDPAGSDTVSRWNVSLAAWYATEAEKLAERAHYP
jgi:ABC-type Fe3+ transport system substrate-binding protein